MTAFDTTEQFRHHPRNLLTRDARLRDTIAWWRGRLADSAGGMPERAPGAGA
jgi:hypothetical protein